MKRKQLLEAAKNLGINDNNIDTTPVTFDGVAAVRLANNSGIETFFTASDVYDGGEWTESDEQRKEFLKANFG